MVKFKAIGVSEGLAKAKALVIKEEDLSVVKDRCRCGSRMQARS